MRASPTGCRRAGYSLVVLGVSAASLSLFAPAAGGVILPPVLHGIGLAAATTTTKAPTGPTTTTASGKSTSTTAAPSLLGSNSTTTTTARTTTTQSGSGSSFGGSTDTSGATSATATVAAASTGGLPRTGGPSPIVPFAGLTLVLIGAGAVCAGRRPEVR